MRSSRPRSAAADAVCRVCGGATVGAGLVEGRTIAGRYALRRCPACGYAFVVDPPDPALVYTPAYYRGLGADPLVDYRFEVDHLDDTVRVYEWRGILRTVAALTSLSAATRWIDYGCGLGGLVRYVRAEVGCDIRGAEEGWAAEELIRSGAPFAAPDVLDRLAGTVDVVTAIEVIEHVHAPLPFLRALRDILRPGGLLFLTTGNARPYADRLARWRYVTPEIHVSFFEPRTLALALERTGFRSESRGLGPGRADIVRFKVLKNLGVRRRALWECLLPWPLIAAAVDRRYGVSEHPIGLAA
jgi:SAM-dependent methyltransferase